MSICRICGGTVNYRSIKGIIRPLRDTCSCPTAGGPTKPVLDDDFCYQTACGFCGRRPIYFVRHNGGSVFFNQLGWPWEKHGCLGVDDPTVILIRAAIAATPKIKRPDLYQVTRLEPESNGESLLVWLRDDNGRGTVWKMGNLSEWTAEPGSLAALCRQALILVDNSGSQFLVSGPLIKCKLCNSWVEKSKMADHAKSNHSDLIWKMRADEGRTKI